MLWMTLLSPPQTNSVGATHPAPEDQVSVEVWAPEREDNTCLEKNIEGSVQY